MCGHPYNDHKKKVMRRGKSGWDENTCRHGIRKNFEP